MRWAFAILLGLHGLIHLMGPAKAFGLAALPQLHAPISRPLGLVWLLAAVLTLAAAVEVIRSPQTWWMVGAAALVTSQLVIGTAWSDARAGTLANVLLLCGVLLGFLAEGPRSLRAEFDRRDRQAMASVTPGASPVTEADLTSLPPPVQRYLRAVGVVGQPRVQSYRLTFRGRIRGGPTQPWMGFTAEQRSLVDPPERLFFMRARRSGLPLQILHLFAGGQASMRVRLLGAVSLVEVSGPELNRAETVTLFNDLCVLVPGALLSPAVAWEEWDASSARARFTRGQDTIGATLHFDAEGLLVDFVSEDRGRLSEDGKHFVRQRFTTPLRGYRRFGPFRIAASGETWWHPPEGAFSYGEFELVDASWE